MELLGLNASLQGKPMEVRLSNMVAAKGAFSEAGTGERTYLYCIL